MNDNYTLFDKFAAQAVLEKFAKDSKTIEDFAARLLLLETRVSDLEKKINDSSITKITPLPKTIYTSCVSESDPSKIYNGSVTIYPNNEHVWQCECPSSTYRPWEHCKHVKKLQRKYDVPLYENAHIHSAWRYA